MILPGGDAGSKKGRLVQIPHRAAVDAVPSIASLVIIQFLWVWEDLLVALIHLGGTPSVAPIAVTISNLVNSLGGNWQVLTAAAFISMLLPVLVCSSPCNAISSKGAWPDPSRDSQSA